MKVKRIYKKLKNFVLNVQFCTYHYVDKNIA